MDNNENLDVNARIKNSTESLNSFLQSFRAEEEARQAKADAMNDEDLAGDEEILEDGDNSSVTDEYEDNTPTVVDTSSVSEDDSNFSEDELEELF